MMTNERNIKLLAEVCLKKMLLARQAMRELDEAKKKLSQVVYDNVHDSYAEKGDPRAVKKAIDLQKKYEHLIVAGVPMSIFDTLIEELTDAFGKGDVK